VRGDRLVLCYHAVSDRWPAALAVSPRQLEEQVRQLARRGYTARTFSDTLAQGGGERSVAVTFDDAYRSVFEHAFPMLRQLGVPATVFVPTALVNTGTPMSWPGIERWLQGPHASELVGMSWDELGQLRDAGWEIGSHTRSHARLTELDADALAGELAGSRADCEQHLGSRCHSLAYPYGALDERVVRAAHMAGYSAAGAPPSRLAVPRRLHWPRVGVYPRDDLRRFRIKVDPAVRRVQDSRMSGPLGRLIRRL
jgi:peptidoglycan/xylan/chitin deacetylase (PgdA/CDA1 family)